MVISVRPISVWSKSILKLIQDLPAEPQEDQLHISPGDASQTAQSSLSVRPAPAAGPGEAGKGELNNAATWDEFPNGRFGDVKSPAFGAGVDLWTSGVVKVRITFKH
jgi:methylenetetrahydrofolate reductase (NADPH)